MSFEQTRLTQNVISSVSDAPDFFNRRSTGNEIPIVLIPQERSCLVPCWSVPTGPLCILQSWGRDVKDFAPPGLDYGCCNKQIAYCVKRGAITYNAPVKSCPTADNVMVDCDLVIVCKIDDGNPENVKNFCYKLGARRFDEFLRAAVEEAIRQLIRTCLHTEVYELKGGQNNRIRLAKKELGSKFNRFGVVFESMAITDVKFTKSLQDTLQQVTEYSSKMKEQIKKQKHEIDQIEFQRNQKVQELDQVNRRYIQAAQADRTRVEIDRERLVVDANSAHEVATTKTKETAEVNETKARSELENAKASGEREKEERVTGVRAREKKVKINVEQECKSKIVAATAKRDAAKAEAQAIIIEAEAEKAAAASLKVMREHELRMAKMEVLQAMAANNKIVISGEQGDKLINELMDSSVMGTMKLLG